MPDTSIYFPIIFSPLPSWQHMASVNRLHLITYIHTYIDNWSLQPFSLYYDLVPIRLFRCAFILYRVAEDLQFKVGSEPQIFEKLFTAILFPLRNAMKCFSNVSFRVAFESPNYVVWEARSLSCLKDCNGQLCYVSHMKYVFLFK